VDSNKHIIEEIVRQVGHLPELYEDARSEKYKIEGFGTCSVPWSVAYSISELISKTSIHFQEFDRIQWLALLLRKRLPFALD
jgi:hypothetical protein